MTNQPHARTFECAECHGTFPIMRSDADLRAEMEAAFVPPPGVTAADMEPERICHDCWHRSMHTAADMGLLTPAGLNLLFGDEPE